MCLAIPGQVVSVHDDRGTKMGMVSFDGVDKEVCLAFLPDVRVGCHVIVHAGFAIAEMNEDAATETLQILAEIGDGDFEPMSSDAAAGDRA